MALKLVKVAILVVSAIDLANADHCNSSRNSDVLERAFGQVIDSRLENQTVIMLDQMQDQDTFLQVIIEKLNSIMKKNIFMSNNQDIIIQKQIVKLNEIKDVFTEKLKEQNEGFEEVLDRKLQEQVEYFEDKFEYLEEKFREHDPEIGLPIKKIYPET